MSEPGSADLMLGPATRLLWRATDSVHLELGGRGVVVDGLPAALVRRVATPVSPHDPAPALPPSAGPVLATLVEAGYLWHRSADPDDPRLAAPHPRLAGELAALAVRHGERAAEVLSSRRHACVQVAGVSRLTAHLAALLAAAGLGRVHCSTAGAVRLGMAMPGGVSPGDEGEPLSAAAAAAVRRAASEVDTTPLPADERADLTVLAVDGPLPEDRLAAFHARNAAYLVVSLGLDGGVIGPLVLPGLTSCLRCADLHRGDRDPAWSALAVQLTVERRHGPASSVPVAAVIAGIAAQQALAYLDGDEPDCLDATLEYRPPDYRVRRRSWPPHPDCGCAGAPDPVSPRTLGRPPS
jgi:uncharacterized metal-binding protein